MADATFTDHPTGRCPEVRRARRYLDATHESVSALLKIFNGGGYKVF
jgi:hypothetical protein